MSTQPTRTLDTFANPKPERDYTIRIQLPEFTCLCPLTGQPDFANMLLEYVPDGRCVELKGLKLYIWSYRDDGAFHEAVTNQILDDIVAACEPRFARLTAEFNVRGGTYPTITAEYRAAGMAGTGARDLAMTPPADKPAGLRRGAAYVLRGLRLIREPSVRVYVIIPLLINIVLFSLGIASIAWGLDLVMDRFLPDWLDWLRFLLWPLFFVAALVIVFYGFSLLANLVASPFNGMLAAAVERHLTGETEHIPFSFSALWREILRTVGAELRKLAYFVLWALPCLLLFVIPGINVIAAPLWFAFGAWMLAIEYVDCPLGNHGQPYPAVRMKLRPKRRLALGFGGTVMALTMIPVVNFIAMPVGVAAATALYLDELRGRLTR